MGFIYEQYKLDNKEDNYSNAIGFGCGFILNKNKKAKCEAARTSRKIKKSYFSIKEFFGIGDGKIFGKVTNPTKQVYSESLKKAERKQAVAESEKSKDSWINADGNAEGVTTMRKKIYIGIGIVLVGALAFSLIKKNK